MTMQQRTEAADLFLSTETFVTVELTETNKNLVWHAFNTSLNWTLSTLVQVITKSHQNVFFSVTATYTGFFDTTNRILGYILKEVLTMWHLNLDTEMNWQAFYVSAVRLI